MVACGKVGHLKPYPRLRFAELHGITVAQAQTLMEQGGTLDLEDGVLACQVINNQPTVARFNAKQCAKAKKLMDAQGLGHGRAETGCQES